MLGGEGEREQAPTDDDDSSSVCVQNSGTPEERRTRERKRWSTFFSLGFYYVCGVC